ncbi:Transposable element Tcb1 transposase [Holothuria leucospilota]|uniref:Transposable element Tcb1 transposase n=1 Tax=Holothuria leucospilota TaxID=206669 RepID=A0A9Q1BNT8_HOLLE|nr:Transposable element Tcb1 transposase [Holothuria leucospilota]
MPRRIPPHIRMRIVHLHKQGLSVTKIRESLKQEGIVAHYNGIHGIILRYEETGTVADRLHPGRPSQCPPIVDEIIENRLRNNDELTAADLQREITKETGKKISISTIKEHRQKLGWVCTGTRYCQLVRQANKKKRLIFALNCLSTGETFENVIFTDECSIELDNHANITFRNKNDKLSQRKLKPKPKHPLKVHVWAGISSAGATPIHIFEGIMDSQFYVENILRKVLLPFIQTNFSGNNYRFCQDNDPKHRSRLAMAFLEENNINYWETPAESPDMNPIENVWHELKHYLRKVSPRKKAKGCIPLIVASLCEGGR